jgi:hypothetical protein
MGGRGGRKVGELGIGAFRTQDAMNINYQEPNTMNLQVYVLSDHDVEQAAWVRSSTLRESATALANKTHVPVVISDDYGWVLFPEERQFSDDQEKPSPSWEFVTHVRGPADLKCMPEYIQSLREKCAPQRPGRVVTGRRFARSTPLALRRIPATTVVGNAEVCHSGYRKPYPIKVIELLGYPKNPDLMVVGNTALLELAPEEEAHLEFGDVLRVRLKTEKDGDIWVIGRMTRKCVVLNIAAIESTELCSSAKVTV